MQTISIIYIPASEEGPHGWLLHCHICNHQLRYWAGCGQSTTEAHEFLRRAAKLHGEVSHHGLPEVPGVNAG